MEERTYGIIMCIVIIVDTLALLLWHNEFITHSILQLIVIGVLLASLTIWFIDYVYKNREKFKNFKKK